MNSGFFLVLIAIFVFMWLLLIRPQRQQQKRHKEMIENLKVGDEVVTAGGIYGDVSEVEPDRVRVMIAEDVEIEVTKRAISSVVPPEPEEPDLGAAAQELEREQERASR